jgi:D-alanine-D-alanine ligase-like ATP-grasp enzyme
MKPLAVRRTDPPTGRAAPLGRDRVRVRSLDLAVGGVECGPASQALGGHDAKDVKGGPNHSRPTNLKPNIYYEAQEFTLGVHRIPGCRGASRADLHLTGTAGQETESFGPGFNARRGPTETSSAPDSAVRAGFSLEEPARGMAEDAACDC